MTAMFDFVVVLCYRSVVVVVRLQKQWFPWNNISSSRPILLNFQHKYHWHIIWLSMIWGKVALSVSKQEAPMCKDECFCLCRPTYCRSEFDYVLFLVNSFGTFLSEKCIIFYDYCRFGWCYAKFQLLEISSKLIHCFAKSSSLLSVDHKYCYSIS